MPAFSMKPVRWSRSAFNAFRRILRLPRHQPTSPGQAAGTHDFDPLGVEFDADVCPVEEPVPVHDGICDRLTERPGWVLPDVLPL